MRPSFIIIGAMKCATSSLYDQLLLQSGIFMPELKEPNFFSDDAQFRKGMSWYQSLFSGAEDGDLLGEASTHYTKMPTYPHTLERMKESCPELRLIYVMRHPIDRLVSQYIHEWSQGNISVDINEAIHKHPELIAYSRYAHQIQYVLHKYDQESLLPIFFEQIRDNSQTVLERVCAHIGYLVKPSWQEAVGPSNVSKDRIRKFPLYSLLIESSLATFIRRNLVPQGLRDKVKQQLQMRKRPELSAESLFELQQIFDKDLAKLGAWLGVKLTCENYRSVVTSSALNWVER